VQHRSENGGIVAASNDALTMATGRYIALLDHDDVLEPHALAEVATRLEQDPTIDYLYTDEDILSAKGRMVDAFRKPSWSPERFRSQMYVCHLSVIHRELLDRVGGFRPGFDGSQDYDLMLRVTEEAGNIANISKILYHWRVGESSVAANPDAKPYAYTAGQRAIAEHCVRVGIDADVSIAANLPGNYVVRRRPAIIEPHFTIVIVDDHTTSSVWGVERNHTEETVENLVERATGSHNITVVDKSERSLLEHYQDALESCNSDLLLVMSNKVEIETDGWDAMLASFLQDADVGAVTPSLWTSESTILHSGFVLRPHNIESAGTRLPRSNNGFRAIFRTDREVSALGTRFTLFSAEALRKSGGFTSTFNEPFASADVSLRVRHAGYRLIATHQVNAFCFDREGYLGPERIRMNSDFARRWADDVAHDSFAGLPPAGETRADRRPKWRPQRLRDYT
jgi:GT2 family glycosyltransferase